MLEKSRIRLFRGLAQAWRWGCWFSRQGILLRLASLISDTEDASYQSRESPFTGSNSVSNGLESVVVRVGFPDPQQHLVRNANSQAPPQMS